MQDNIGQVALSSSILLVETPLSCINQCCFVLIVDCFNLWQVVVVMGQFHLIIINPSFNVRHLETSAGELPYEKGTIGGKEKIF